ncbi:MAG TPA: hypothetical protein VMZ31_10710 [Phycisphaerae bacterium]|nr:hypothetical protein [Phycisphaerae bacterium]
MNCSRIQPLLAECVCPASRAPAVRWQAVVWHVGTCPTCAVQAAKMRRAMRLVQNTPEVLTGAGRVSLEGVYA